MTEQIERLAESCSLIEGKMDNRQFTKGQRFIDLDVSNARKQVDLYYNALKAVLNGTLVLNKSMIITPASENDMNVFRDNWSGISGKTVFADKAYLDNSMQNKMLLNDSELLAPVKFPRGTPNVVKLRNAAADKLFSRAVSSIRQPIVSLFAWLIHKSDIQKASKVRSEKGLMVHIFAILAAAFTVICFNS